VPDSDPSGTLGSELSALWKKINAEVKNAFTLSELQNGQAQTEIPELTHDKNDGIIEKDTGDADPGAKTQTGHKYDQPPIEKGTIAYSIPPGLPTSVKKEKPRYAPRVEKWEGTIEVNEQGQWFYTDQYGNCVPYIDGYPDFEAAGFVKASTWLDKFSTRGKDKKAALSQLGLTTKDCDGYAWHHHQDRHTMQLVPEEIHSKFYHEGGFSLSLKLGGK